MTEMCHQVAGRVVQIPKGLFYGWKCKVVVKSTDVVEMENSRIPALRVEKWKPATEAEMRLHALRS